MRAQRLCDPLRDAFRLVWQRMVLSPTALPLALILEILDSLHRLLHLHAAFVLKQSG